MKLSMRQRVVIGFIWVPVIAVSLVQATHSMGCVLYLIAFCAVMAALALEIEEYSAVLKKRNQP